jgi:hypothetical protein
VRNRVASQEARDTSEAVHWETTIIIIGLEDWANSRYGCLILIEIA